MTKEEAIKVIKNQCPSREMILNVWELGNYWKELTGGSMSTEHGTQLDYILKHWTEGEYYSQVKVGDSITNYDDDSIRQEILEYFNKKNDYRSRWFVWVKNASMTKKGEWSEEDEKILKAIHNSVDVKCLSKNGLDYVVMVEWFKSLKDRVLPQPKQEWSEEDEWCSRQIDYHLYNNDEISDDEAGRLRNWVKLLKKRLTK